MKCFLYKDKIYTRILPSKRLFNSTTIYEVVNRGDIFCLCLDDMVFTVIPGKFIPTFFEVLIDCALPMPLLEKEMPSQENISETSLGVSSTTEVLGL